VLNLGLPFAPDLPFYRIVSQIVIQKRFLRMPIYANLTFCVIFA
jgi:hypothetical protein